MKARLMLCQGSIKRCIKRVHELAGANRCSQYLFDKKQQQLTEMAHDDDRPAPTIAIPQALLRLYYGAIKALLRRY
jgi:hypothetical protein